MIGSIQDQLRDYVDDVTSQSVPVDFDDVMRRRFGAESVRPIRPFAQPASVQHRPWLGASIAAAAVFILIGGAALLTRASGTDTEVGATPTTAPNTLQTATPSLPTWFRVTDDDVLADRVPFTAGMRDVTVGGPGLVAVGEGDDGAAVWTSADGITWSRVARDYSVFGGGPTMFSVTSGNSGLVAVGGEDGPGDEGDGFGDAAVWTSADGFTWSRVTHDESVFGGEGQQQMVSVTAGGPGLVAVGWDTSEGTADAAVWTSVDGISWSRVPGDEGVFGGPGEQTMSSVTVGGPGLVAVGSDGFYDGVDRGQLGSWRRDFLGDAAVWTSADGITWSRVPHEATVFGGEGNQWMDDVTVGGPGLVAVGGDWSSGARAAAVWTSIDGMIWSQVTYDDAVFGGSQVTYDDAVFGGVNAQAMNSVTSTGLGLVAVGRAWATSDSGSYTDPDSAASVWASDDGLTWTWMGYDEAVFGSEGNSRQFMNSVIATDLGVVAVGADWSGPSHGAAVWVAAQRE
jgi:hypothetical protein